MFTSIFRQGCPQLIMASALIVSALGSASQAEAKSSVERCKDTLQGKIAWDYKGSKRWSGSNLNRLCKEAVNEQPAHCFKRVMHGNVNYGGGTRWQWKNAIDLCEQSTNAKRTISCFQKKIRSGVAWGKAVQQCDERMLREECHDALQGKVAWGPSGQKRWELKNMKRLCGNARSTQPAICFQRVMKKRPASKKKEKWDWKKAIDVCEGATNANVVLSCLDFRFSMGMAQARAIELCGR